MAILAGDIVKTTVPWALPDGTVCQNIFHHQRIGLGIFTDAAIVAAIASWVETMYAEIDDATQTTVLEQLCSCEKIAWETDKWEIVENIGVFTPAFTPTLADNLLPNMVSAFAVFKTSRPKTVGRKFMFPFTEVTQEGSYLTAPTVTKMVAWADDAVNDIELQVGDYMRPGVPRTGVDAWYAFTVGIITNLLGSQRRRRPGVGS